MKPVRLLLVDDHKIVRQGLRFILDPNPYFDILAEAGSGEEAMQLLSELDLDVVILDIQLPDRNGADICQRIMELYPKMVVIILTAFIDRQLVNDCLRAGASGYLLKDAENLHLEEQILAAVHGQTPLDPRVAGIVTDILIQQKPSSEQLSPREMEVLQLIAGDLTNQEIGTKLAISVNTVKQHIKHILEKLNARNRVEAIIKARDRNIL